MLVIANWRRDHIKPSVPLVWAAKMKETHESVKLLLDLIKYTAHGWYICADLKVVAILTRLQTGHKKHLCFLCLLDSCDNKNHFICKEWSARTQATLGRYSIKNMPLVDPNKILLPPLHIKLGLMKTYVKKLPKRESHGLKFLKDIWFI